ncbi:MAG: hypothetical protein PHF74_04965 [Dehalococcoidales bacterium]|nr:hypothetical protein [Dehalococcoidales bacterium]
MNKNSCECLEDEKNFCEHLKDGKCKVLKNIKCLPYERKRNKSCSFADNYNRLQENGNLYADKINIKVMDQAQINWHKFMQDEMPNGRKNMTAKPLEDAIRKEISNELTKYNVNVTHKPVKIPIQRI